MRSALGTRAPSAGWWSDRSSVHRGGGQSPPATGRQEATEKRSGRARTREPSASGSVITIVIFTQASSNNAASTQRRRPQQGQGTVEWTGRPSPAPDGRRSQGHRAGTGSHARPGTGRCRMPGGAAHGARGAVSARDRTAQGPLPRDRRGCGDGHGSPHMSVTKRVACSAMPSGRHTCPSRRFQLENLPEAADSAEWTRLLRNAFLHRLGRATQAPEPQRHPCHRANPAARSRPRGPGEPLGEDGL